MQQPSLCWQVRVSSSTMPKPCIPVIPHHVGVAWLRLLHLLDMFKINV